MIGVQLPGRERRWTEPFASTVDDVVRAVVDEVVELVPAERPLVVFGQSFGGLLGYEICRELGAGRDRWPTALVVAACRPPHMWVGAGRGLVDDDAELARLLDLRHLGEDDLDEDSREQMLEVLRQDARLSLTYQDPRSARLACPVRAWGGDDDEIVTTDQLDGWRDYAAGDFHRRQFPGGHHFCVDQVDAVASTLRELTTPDHRRPT